MARASAGRSTLSRQLQLLDAFSIDSPFLSLSELSRRSGLPVGTTHALLADLEEQRLVERGADRTYRLGIRLWELACRTPGALGLREIAMPHLQEVHGSIGQHVQLGILSGGDVLFLERLSSRDAVVNATIIGGRLPLHASAAGLVLMADADAATRDEVLAGPLRSLTDATIADAAELRRVLHRVRTQRFAVADGYIHPSARGIAVPVTGAAGETVASVGAVVPNDDAPWIPLVDSLQSAAEHISAALRAAALPQAHPEASPGGRYRALVSSSDESMQYLAGPANRRQPHSPAGATPR
ncbi:IclR family transcriptional regulator [Agromyces fucosus]|uniref:IclR family transcriptional regulator n=1 Tax=Agromyces fucosus TaxID=41985 RepID=A0A4Q2JTK3_9MICO|nr:IclR family transcriptional regulator [Agromyces fucosus]RXZ50614.1 IclR family transcriptional regulator [Agromyces fucosus]